MTLRFIQITDTHIAETPESLVWFYATGAALRSVLKQIAQNDKHDAAFMVQTGDVIISFRRPQSYDCVRSVYEFDGSPATLGPLTIRAEGIDMPWYCVPGNTDVRSECYARLFHNCAPAPFFNYCWEVQGTRFLSLDWGASGVDNYTLEPATFSWLRQQLQRKTRTIIFTHHPPVHVGVKRFDDHTPADLNRLQELIAGSSTIAVFHGHTHYPWENRIGEIPVFGTGSVGPRGSLHYADEQVMEIHPPQYRVVTVHDDGSVTAPIHKVPLPW